MIFAGGLLSVRGCRGCLQLLPRTEFNRCSKNADGLALQCRPCRKASRNPEAERQRRVRYYAENHEVELARMRKYQSENRAVLRASCRKWREKNPEAQHEAERNWRLRNPHACAALAAKRHAAVRRRTPPWLTAEHFEAIKAVYLLASRITKATGVPHEVDHVVPLQGQTVSGLHVPWNLQVLPEVDNVRKGNRFP